MKTQPTSSFLKPSNLRVSNRTIDQFQARLQPGDTIRGRVVGHFGNNKALVSFKGFNVVTEAPAQLDKGEIINVRILAIGDKITMRLVRPGTNSTVKFTATITDILNDMNLSVNEDTRTIVKALIQYEIPLTAENIESVLSYASSIGGEFEQAIELIVLAWFLNLPPNSRIFSDLRLFNSKRTPLSQQLNSLKNLLNELVSQDTIVDSDFIQEFMNFLDGLTLTPGKGNITTQIKQLLENLGLEYEHTLLAATQENTNLLQDGLKWLNQTLKGMLLELRGQLLNSETRSQVAERTLRVIEGILQNFEIQEITQGNIRELPRFYLQIPYLVDGELANLEFMARKINEDGEGKELDLNNASLSFLVNTVNLGDIKINLDILQGKVGCAILTENESTRNFVDSYKEELVNRLETLDYSVRYIHCKTTPEEVKLELFEEPPELVGDVVQIDVTA